MPRRSSGHLAVGSCSTLLGAAAIVAGVMKPGALAGSLAGTTPIWALFITGGCVLTLAGVLVILFTFRGEPEEPAVVPAHVAFHSRMSIEPVVPGSLLARPAPAAISPPPRRLPAPQPTTQGRVAPPVREDLAAIDGQIRELTRQISKAGVMLATGQLSQGGYLEYVEDIKRQRGKLEAQRIRAELRST